jgi:hypothetical protein
MKLQKNKFDQYSITEMTFDEVTSIMATANRYLKEFAPRNSVLRKDLVALQNAWEGRTNV